MPIDALEKCIKTLKEIREDEIQLNGFSESNYDVYNNLLSPFERELDFNLLEKQSDPKWEKKLLIFYLHAHMSINQKLYAYVNLIFESNFKQIDDKWYDSKSNIYANQTQSLVLKAFEVYESLFFILEDKCNERGFNIVKLAEENNLHKEVYEFIIDKKKNEQEESANNRKLLEEYMISKFAYIRNEMGLPELPRDEILKDIFASNASKALLGSPVDYFADSSRKQEMDLDVIQDKSIDRKKETKKYKLTVKQIALIYVYEGKAITRDKANGIAADYGFLSGDGLYQDYTELSSRANRKGKPVPFTRLKMKNKIKFFESILELLDDKFKKNAIEDIETLKSIHEDAEY